MKPNEPGMSRQDMEWLVENRNAIQKTALDLYDLLQGDGRPWILADGKPMPQMQIALIKQDLVGVFFCLWRGVFLAANKASKLGEPPAHAISFLTKIISDNSISFLDDKKYNQWTANFYVDSAGRILNGFVPSATSKATPRCEAIEPKWIIDDFPASIKDRWKYNHDIFQKKIRSLIEVRLRPFLTG